MMTATRVAYVEHYPGGGWSVGCPRCWYEPEPALDERDARALAAAHDIVFHWRRSPA